MQRVFMIRFTLYALTIVAVTQVVTACGPDHNETDTNADTSAIQAPATPAAGEVVQKKVDYELYEHDPSFQPMLGEPAPGFTLNDVNDRQYMLQQFRGKHVVIHFAASWCPFCTQEGPYLEDLYQDYKSQGVQVLVIDVMEPKHIAAKVKEINDFSFPVLCDLDGSVARAYAPEGVMPELTREEVPIASNLIIDDAGVIQFYTLLDTENFDTELVQVRTKLDELLQLN
jgi:peroxiredoxin